MLFFEPLFLKIGVTWAIFQILGKYPISKWLLNSLESEKEISVDINCRNLPEIPHGEMCDFFKFLINLATSIGDVFKRDKSGMF